MRLSTIPFAGFYNTWHDEALDDALEQAFTDSSGNPLGGKFHDAWEHVDWQAVHTAYARRYVENFADEFEIKLKFDELNSPREYNFTTDRIFVTMSNAQAVAIAKRTGRAILEAVIKEEFTSCSGFISHYPNELARWPNSREWDHNQMGALMIAFVRTVRGSDMTQSDEFYLMERDRGSGYFENWIFEAGNDKLKRLDKICWYLRQREERQYRVAA